MMNLVIGDYPTARKALALLIEERRAMKSVMRHALTDIDYLLKEGFDTNVDDCDMDGLRETIAELKGQQNPAYANNEANARLIAASTDLLAALRQLMEWEGYDGGPPGNGHDEDTDRREQEVWQDAQDAIDKATGEEK